LLKKHPEFDNSGEPGEPKEVGGLPARLQDHPERDLLAEEGQPGTLDSAIVKLPYLRELGINAVEVMPIAEFSGDFLCGYNPSHPFAVVGACAVISLPGGTDNAATIPQVGCDRLMSCREMMSIVEACVLDPVQEVRVFEDKLATAFASNSDCKSIQCVHFKSPEEGNKVVSDAAGIIVYAA